MTGRELRAWREARGWSQQRLADALGIPQATVSRWESEAMPIRHGTILRLALQQLRKR